MCFCNQENFCVKSILPVFIEFENARKPKNIRLAFRLLTGISFIQIHHVLLVLWIFASGKFSVARPVFFKKLRKIRSDESCWTVIKGNRTTDVGMTAKIMVFNIHVYMKTSMVNRQRRQLKIRPAICDSIHSCLHVILVQFRAWFWHPYFSIFTAHFRLLNHTSLNSNYSNAIDLLFWPSIRKTSLISAVLTCRSGFIFG